jgi:hypothetical protein
MSESLGFYVYGLFWFCLGLAAFTISVISVSLFFFLGPAGILFSLYGAALMEGISWKEIKDYVRALLQRRRV